MVDVPHDGVVATVVVDAYQGDALRRRDRSYLRSSADRFTEQAKRLGFDAPPLRAASTQDAGTPGPPLERGRVRELVARLRAQPAGRKILYWTGHGERVGDTFYLACQDSYASGRFDPARAVSAAELVSWLAEDTTDTLLVLDACFSGTALDDVNQQVKAARAARAGNGRRGDAGFAVIATAEADEEAVEGRWTARLKEVLDTADAQTRAVPLFHRENPVVPFTHLMLAVRALAADQVPEWAEVRTLRPDFLLNPYCSERVRPALRPSDDESWIGEELSADAMPLFSGSGEGRSLRDFSSRDRILGELVTWMATRSTGLFALSGASGAGKSTLLTYLAHLTTRGFAASLPPGRRPRIQPELYSVHAALHCRGKTLAALCEELARRLGALGLGRPDGPGHAAPHLLVERIAALARRKGSLTLLFDGLDEAAAGHAFDIARGLINPLAGTPLVKAVVTTRPNARRNLPGELPAETLLEALHCEDPVELDRLPETEGDIARHVERLLGRDGSPYRPAGAEEARRAAARHIASRSNGLFLVATLWARRLAGLGELPEPDRLDGELRHGTAVLDSLLGDELDRLDPAEPARIRDLLRPLALAQGNGLPQPRVWLAMAHAVRPPGSREYTEDDLRHVIAAATGVVVARDGEFGTEVHRLHHPGFGTHLLGDEARQRRLHRRVALALRPPRSEDWASAEPYVTHYAAAHAALAGDATLDELTGDYHFTVHAPPDVLEPLVATRLAVAPRPALYAQVADHFRTHPAPAARWAVLRATALAVFPAEVLQGIPRPPEVFWDDVWSSADRLPLQRSWPAPMGGALAVHWEGGPGREGHGEGLIHAAGAGVIRSWTAGGQEVRGRDTGPAGWTTAGRQRGLAVAEGGAGHRVMATHDGRALRLWRGDERHPFEELYWGGAPEAVTAAWWNGLVHLAAVEDGRLWLWKWDGTGTYARDLLRLRVLPAAVSAAALLPLEGAVTAVAGGPGGLTLWAVPLRGTVPTEPLHGAAPLLGTGRPVRALSAFALPDGRGAALAALDGRALSVWRMPDPLFDDRRELLLRTPSAGQAVSLGEGPAGLLVAVREGSEVRVWSGSGTEHVPLPCTSHHRSLAFDPSGSGRLAVADEIRVRVWEPHAPADRAAPAARRRPRGGDPRANPQAAVATGTAGEFLLCRSEDGDVLVSLHTPAGPRLVGPVLTHGDPVTALAAAADGEGWTVAAVGRRTARVWTLGPGLDTGATDELHLAGARDVPVPSVALRAVPGQRLQLFWPSGQGVACWERDPAPGAGWARGATRPMGASGAVQRVAVAGTPQGRSWLSAWGGDAVRVWDLDAAGARPFPVDSVLIHAVATGVLRKGRRTVPLVAIASGNEVEIAECEGWLFGTGTTLPPPPGDAPLDGLALAGPAHRPLLAGWRNTSGRLHLWDVAAERALPDVEPRGYDVSQVVSAFGDAGITLLVRGGPQAALRCDQLLLTPQNLTRLGVPVAAGDTAGFRSPTPSPPSTPFPEEQLP
ncbi:NACHT domain-containing protein [Streptomyces lavendulae]|uniref:NACHT domain-containing protein n=1 Tax=Streptomyces lavendulae TaxID=1914 RepID=UPI0024A456F3|nr:NACHT domain-containing protein [Streptomyces lavendulae]GLX17564.1 hypothetical protein Slala01_12080 [Streptomyces lavendulae subsp. lavendulae]GLX24575.1 hypothetical protein Slala02_03950 [Streptomyces lavendulae subsp. lavendulae]